MVITISVRELFKEKETLATASTLLQERAPLFGQVSKESILYMHFLCTRSSLSHKALQLKSNGIDGSLLNWRKQRVVVRGSCSDWSCVTSGTPQGTILRTYLSLIECYKIVFGFYHLKFEDFFDFATTRSTRANHQYKLYVKPARLNC